MLDNHEVGQQKARIGEAMGFAGPIVTPSAVKFCCPAHIFDILFYTLMASLFGSSPLLAESSCLTERKNAQLQVRRDHKVGVVIPECRPDGSYNQVQCHRMSGTLEEYS